jgi:thioesterase domain-containing protein
MARAYVETLLEARPDGPFIVGGFCTGGAVAYEAVRQLERRGRRALGLVLIDSFVLKDVGTEVERDVYNAQQLQLAGLDQDSIIGRQIVRQLEDNRRLVTQYNPPVYAGECLFIQCRHIEAEDINRRHLEELQGELNGWAPFLASATVRHRQVEASHRTIFREEPVIRTIGREIEDFVKRITHPSYC